jgi:hypothetical protein
MNKINIEPVTVGLGITANVVAFQVLTFDLSPDTFNLNARFYNEIEAELKEVSNIPFTLPIEDYETWKSDAVLENKCLKALNLVRA